MTAKRLVHRFIRTFGYDVVRFPHESLLVHLEQLFKDLKVDSVLDVGAHEGHFAQSLRGIGYKGRIESFEPVAATYAVLADASKNDRLWHAHGIALGAQAGIRSITVTEMSSFSSFLTPAATMVDAFPGSKPKRHEEVEVKRLDDLWTNLSASERVFLKVDTQGWDLEVVKGASRCLDSVVAIQSELSLRPIYENMPSYVESILHLTGLGYAVTGIFPVIRDQHGRLVEIDCVLVRSG